MDSDWHLITVGHYKNNNRFKGPYMEFRYPAWRQLYIINITDDFNYYL